MSRVCRSEKKLFDREFLPAGGGFAVMQGENKKRMGRPPTPVVLTDEERRDLERWARGRTVSHKLVIRARIILACSEGMRTD